MTSMPNSIDSIEVEYHSYSCEFVLRCLSSKHAIFLQIISLLGSPTSDSLFWCDVEASEV